MNKQNGPYAKASIKQWIRTQPMRLQREPEYGDRGLAIGFVKFFAMLIVAALLYTLFNPAVDQVLTTASAQATHTTAQDEIDLAEQIWNNLLFFGVFVSFLFIIARAVVEQRRGP